MIDIKSLKELDTKMVPYIRLIKELTGKDTVLDRIIPLMKILGNPENKIKTIHIAGTSGKTSTSYYISSLLIQSGNKVGLTVSPHIDKISERAQINGKPLEDKIFFKEISEFLDIVAKSKIKPSYFELLYAFSIWLFAKYKVDYAVVETGLGGLYDATNVITNPNKICVITDLGYDHMQILGNSIEEITSQKVGIVHEGNHLIMYRQSDAIMNVINSWISSRSTTHEYLNQNIEYEANQEISTYIDKLPQYQKRNWLLAKHTYDFIKIRDNLIGLNNDQLIKSINTIVPARMDEIKLDNKRIIMDGAHNPQKMEAFTESYNKKYKDKANIILGFKEGKDFPETLKYLTTIANKIYLTTFNTSQDLPAVSIDPFLVAEELTKQGFNNFEIIPDQIDAYNEAIRESNNINIVITGSFYLIAQLRNKIL